MSTSQIMEHHRKLQKSRNDVEFPMLDTGGYMESARRSLMADINLPLFTTDAATERTINLENKRTVTPEYFKLQQKVTFEEKESNSAYSSISASSTPKNPAE